MTHQSHEISEYAARHGIPTIHESPQVASEEDIEIRRLRFDLSGIRGTLTRLAGPHPDGTCMDDPESFDRKWADAHGCGHPKDPGYTMSRLSFFARSAGLEHPEVSAVLILVAALENRLPGEFEAVREEYLAWHRAQIEGGNKMFAEHAAENGFAVA